MATRGTDPLIDDPFAEPLVRAVGVDFFTRVASGDAHIMALAAPGDVLVSGTIPPPVLRSRITFDDRGSHKLNGVPDRGRCSGCATPAPYTHALRKPSTS